MVGEVFGGWRIDWGGIQGNHTIPKPSHHAGGPKHHEIMQFHPNYLLSVLFGSTGIHGMMLQQAFCKARMIVTETPWIWTFFAVAVQVVLGDQRIEELFEQISRAFGEALEDTLKRGRSSGTIELRR